MLLIAHDSPYSQKKFQDILHKSKLQAPKSEYNPRYGVKYGKFKDVSHEFFYLQDNKDMLFAMCGKKHRSELRLKHEWKVETPVEEKIFARLRLFPLNQKKEFTFLQIHANSNRAGENGKKLNKPLLRLTWWREQKNRYDHLWAVIRLSSNVYEQKYVKIDLGRRPDGYFTAMIKVQNSRMKVFIDDKLKIDMNVDYWNGYWNYFKAGVYNQGDGCAKVLFDNLEVT